MGFAFACSVIVFLSREGGRCVTSFFLFPRNSPTVGRTRFVTQIKHTFFGLLLSATGALF